MTLSESPLRIAPRSAVANADLHLLRVARTDLVASERPAGSLVDRVRARLRGAGRRD